MEPDNSDILQIIISETDIQRRIKELADEISVDYQGKKLLLICVMNGSTFFSVDLIRKLSIHADLDFISVTSYHGGAVSTGSVTLLRDISTDLSDKHIIILEDILDSGRTFSYLLEHLSAKKPLSIRACALLDKPGKRVVDVDLHYRGFEIPDIFIVGYGMDYLQKYRQLPFIGELKPEIYS